MVHCFVVLQNDTWTSNYTVSTNYVVFRSFFCFAAEVIQFWALKSAHILNWAGAIVLRGRGLRKTNVLWTEVDSKCFSLKAWKAQGKLFASLDKEQSQSRRLHLDYAELCGYIPESPRIRLERHKTWYQCESIHSSILEGCHLILLSRLWVSICWHFTPHLHAFAC